MGRMAENGKDPVIRSKILVDNTSLTCYDALRNGDKIPMERKTYTLSEQITEQIEDLQEKSKQNGTILDASTIVRLALLQGLPMVAENLFLETTQRVDNTKTALV